MGCGFVRVLGAALMGAMIPGLCLSATMAATVAPAGPTVPPAGSVVSQAVPPASITLPSTNALLIDDPVDPSQVELASAPDAAERMTVPVQVNGSGPFRFVIDTGADHTVVSDRLARALALPPAPGALLHGIAGVQPVAMAAVSSLDIAGRTREPFHAAVLNQTWLGATGLLGMDSLGDRRVEIDFRTNTMTVLAAGTRGRSGQAQDAIVVTGRRQNGQLIITEASFRGRRVDVVLDTGAELTVGNLALLELLQRKKAKLELAEVISVTGQRATVQIASIPEMRIGALRFAGTPVAFGDLHCFERFGMLKRPALLLGMNVLRQFDRIAIDFAKRRVSFALAPRG